MLALEMEATEGCVFSLAEFFAKPLASRIQGDNARSFRIKNSEAQQNSHRRKIECVRVFVEGQGSKGAMCVCSGGGSGILVDGNDKGTLFHILCTGQRIPCTRKAPGDPWAAASS